MNPEPSAVLVGETSIRAAACRIRSVAMRTPLVRSVELSERLDGEVRLKCESMQRAGAFKIRGAYNRLVQFDRATLDRGVIAASSGNHGQAAALAARMLGSRAVVVMPHTAPRVKREGVERFGGEVVLAGTTSLERREVARRIAAERGLTLVPSFEDPEVVAGQGTVGLELTEEWPGVEVVVVPVGGGGLASGIAAAVKAIDPRIRVVGVEPAGAAAMRAALDAGRPVTFPNPTTIADGLAASRVSELTLAHFRALVDDLVTVDDARIREAAAFLLLRQKLLVEFSGAAAVAALLALPHAFRGRRVAAVLSGGNIDPAAIRSLLPG